jgi:hypothetical protein
VAKFVSSAVFLAVLVCLAGCASTARLRETIQSSTFVSVDHAVAIPSTVVFNGPGVFWAGVLGGALGRAIERRQSSVPEQIKAYLQKENINVQEILRETFLRALNNDPRFSGRIAENSSVRFELEIYMYGLEQDDIMYSPNYRPILGVRAKLVNADGDVLWRDREWVNVGRPENIPAVPFNAYFDTPDTFRTSFSAASDAIVRAMMKDLDSALTQ